MPLPLVGVSGRGWTIMLLVNVSSQESGGVTVVRIADENGDKIEVRPRVKILWGKNGAWTKTVNDNLEWKRLLEAELTALRFEVNKREQAIQDIEEMHKKLS